MAITEYEPRERVQVLDADGRVLDGATVPDLADEALRGIYRGMYLARRLDRRAVKLNRRGEVSSFPPLYGHEAAQVASAHAMADDDWLVPSYRDYGACMAHGVDPAKVLQYFNGFEVGNAMPEDLNVLPINGSVASQIPHATGIAWAGVLDAEDPPATLCYFGDGATSEGDFHEALNFAGVFDVPAVFFCQNNGWAISVPRERQTAAETLAQKATAYGFEGVQVDGMDPLAVYQVTREALGKAKDPGEGERRPTLVEAVLYRLGPHSTADDPDVYRDGVPEEWQEKEPLERFESFLLRTGRLDEEGRTAIHDEVEEHLDDAIDRALATERPSPDAIFEDTYADLPDRLRSQREWIRGLRERHGDDVLRQE